MPRNTRPTWLTAIIVIVGALAAGAMKFAYDYNMHPERFAPMFADETKRPLDKVPPPPNFTPPAQPQVPRP